MKKFNIQFATQKLREGINEVKFTIDDSNLYSAVMDRYMRDTRMPITDEGDYLETDEETFQGVQAIAMDLDKVDALNRLDSMDETSATGAGANFVPGTGEQYATPKAFKKVKKEEKDVEPKLAAGKAKVYMKDKWGWKEAPSIPNRPSKGGFIYKQLFEALNEDQDIPENIVKFAKRKGISSQLNTIARWVKKAGKRIVGGTAIGKDYNTLVLDLTHQGSEIYYNIEKDTIDVKGYDVENEEEFLAALQKDDSELNENYSRFKKETKTRTNEQQLHAAMRLAEKKIHEANRILEYTAQLRTELTETKVNKNTQKLMEKVTKGIAEAYGKMKKLK
jgi:hypothetical protein